MRHSPRTLALVVSGALFIALVAASAAASSHSNQYGVSRSIEHPKLGTVPAVVHSTTSKKPPKNVKFDGEPMGVAVSGDGVTSAGAPGEVIIPGVPGYGWRHGCGPTALGMVVGYYDGNGWSDLIPGEATSVTPAVNQAIASDASSGAPGHYEDYSLPKETTAAILSDKSDPPFGDEHTSNSIADFMHTSWSRDGLHYGGSFSNMVGSAFVDYATSKYAAAAPLVATYRGSDLTWTLVKQEVLAGRPMMLLVDSSGNGMTDHFVTVVGYREINGTPEYGCWDTWNTGLLRWEQFRALSPAYAWGVWGGITFSLSDSSSPSPSPEPSPTPDPQPSPTDATAPVTVAHGVGTLWHNTSVTVTLSASDAESGVAYTEHSLDGAAWTKGTSVTVPAPRKKAVGVIHTVRYRSVDLAENIEQTRTVLVGIDTTKPSTSSNADKATHVGTFALALTPLDAHSGVAETWYSLDRETYTTGTSILITGRGRHTIRFYSEDNAGNTEKPRSVTVRIR